MGEIFNVSTSAGNFSKLAFDGENVTLLITGLEEGACANVTVDIPFEMPNGIYIYYWKEIPGRQIIPVTYDVSDDNRHLTFQLQDGVVDEDGLTNGEIYDPLSLAPPRFLVTSTISGGEGTLSVTETATGDHYDIGLETSEGIFTSLYLVDAENLPGAGNFVFPYQLVKFTIEDITPSGSTDATITYPDVSSLKDDFSLSYHKFNPNTLAWQNFPAQFSGNTVTLSLTDGGAGDDDAVANGIIADPGGLILEDPADSGGGAAPTSAFSGTPTSGAFPLTVTFTDESAGTPTGWAWFFGDETWTQAWTEVNASAGWSGRCDHTSVALADGSIFVMGGYEAAFNFKNDVWKSTDNGVTWTEVNASAGWSGRCGHTSVVMPDGSIVLMGGSEGPVKKNDVWRSVDKGVTWTEANSNAGWSAREFHTSVVMSDGSILLMGGSDAAGSNNDVWRSADNGATWTLQTASAGWSARIGLTSVSMPDGSIVMMGGYDGEYKNDVWRSTDNGATWTEVNASAGWSARGEHSSVAMPDSSIVLMGGGDAGGLKNDVWRSTNNGATWTEVTGSAGWSGRSGHTSVAMPDGSIVVMGGDVGSRSNEVWSFSPVGSSLQNPSHTYTEIGTYPVLLQAYNAEGYSSLRKAGYISVMPTIAFSGTPRSGFTPLTVTFTDESTYNPTGWAWFFGDETWTQAWTRQTENAGWLARTSHTSVAMPDGSIVLMGGKDTYGSNNDMWRSTNNGVTWVELTGDAEWSKRKSHTSVAMPDGSIVLMGGEDDLGYKNDVWRITDGSSEWIELNASAGWSARYDHTSVAMPDGSIVLMGGGDADGLKNDVWRSTDKGFTWTLQTASAGWSGRVRHTSVAMADGSIVLMGGYDREYKNDVWRSFDNGATWTQLPTPGWSGRAYHTSVAMPDGSIVVMGGFDSNDVKNDVWRSSDNGASWTQLPTPGWSGRAYHTSVAMPDGSIVVMGGFDSEKKNDVWRFSPVGSSLQNPSHTYTTKGTYPVALQAYNADLYYSMRKTGYIAVQSIETAFSGTPTSGAVPLNVAFTDESTGPPTGWAWFFGDETWTQAWTEVNASAGWSGRHDHTSVAMFDGSIVVMGGSDTGYKNDVWRSTNKGTTWTLQNGSASWSARDDHTSVAMRDGSIVLMGGSDDTGYKNDVWRSADNGVTWMLQNGSAGWSGRAGHTSVSLPDGSIILMGGYAGHRLKNDVWRSTDKGFTWTLQTASAGWSGRVRHMSVVMPDGSIVVMGGDDFSGVYKNDVWRSVDKGVTWTLQTPTSGWSGREYHTSVSMADGSIVLMGGSDGAGYKNDVWRSVDNGAMWTKVTGSAGWSAREGHTSVVMPDGSIVLMGGSDAGRIYYKNDVWHFSPVGSSLQNPSHIYNTSGTYPVSLQAYNAKGHSSLRKTGYITLAPVVEFSGTPTSGELPLNVIFTDESTGNLNCWAWFFGDETYTEGWTEQTPAAGLSARLSHTSVAMPDGSIVLMGGSDGVDYKNDVWRSTNKGAIWTEVTGSASWSGRNGHTSVCLPDNSIVVMGGSDGVDYKNDVWRSVDNGAMWTEVTGSAGWSGRHGHTSVVMPDGSIVMMGGSDAGGYKNDVWRSFDNGATWTEVTGSANWSARRGHMSVVMPDGSIVLMGGEDGSNRNDVWRSFDNGATWTEATGSAGWSRRCQHTSVAMPDGSIVVMGGNDAYPGFKNDVWRSFDNGTSWTNLPTPGWSGRFGHTGVAMPDGSIVVMGGYDGAGYKNDVWRFSPVGSSLQNPSHTYTAAGSYQVALQVYNNAGGYTEGYNILRKTGYINVSPFSIEVAFSGTPKSGTHPLNVTFADESTDNPTGWAWFFGDETYTEGWTEVTAAAVWSGRRSHTIVSPADGSIVLMGGYDGEYKNDVWKSTDNGASWTEMNTSAGWSARRSHTSVAMPCNSILVMGGGDAGGLKNDVWLSTDNGVLWTLQNANASWSARYDHTSVAMPDGSILLMGGGDAGGLKNDVWRSFDKGFTWTEVTGSAGWSGRVRPTCVAMPDGNLVLMGGYDREYKNDVWRSTDNGVTWTQLPTPGWSGRAYHTSVVMPDGSIVLMGGYDADGYKNDVWRSVDNGVTWTQLPTHGWSGRAYPTSMSMRDGSIVVMGGFDGENKNDVWRFSPIGSSLQNPSHTYTDVGIYPVSLQAYNAKGHSSLRKTGYIDVSPISIGVAFSGTPESGEVPLTVAFTDESTDNPTGWAWFFGDETWAQPWTHVIENAGWSARWEHTSVVIPDGSIVVMGGYDGLGYKNDVWRSTDNGSTWTEVNAGAGWSGRFGHTGVAMPDGSIVVMGGDDGGLKNDVWRSGDKGFTWTEVNASAGWSAREGHTSVVIPDGSIVVMGGYDGGLKNDVWRSVDNGVTWTLQNGSAGWSARERHTSVVMPDGSIVLMGGEDGSNRNDVWRSTDNGVTWTLQNGNAGWSRRCQHTSVAMPDGSIVVMGGNDAEPGFKNDVWRSFDNGATWTKLPTDVWPWPRRFGHTSVTVPDGSIVLMGGIDYNGAYVNDVWRFSPVGSSEQNPSHTYTVVGTYHVSLQAYNAYGCKSLQKTGYINATPNSIGVEFNVTPTSGAVPLTVEFMDESTGKPTGWAWFFGDETYRNGWMEETGRAGWPGRRSHTSVSMPDGSIVLMGGNVSDGITIKYMNDVWRSVNNGVSWILQTASAGWSARVNYSSVSMPDGSIVVMGGDDGDYKNDVWRSDNNGATWTQMTANASWSPRAGHTSVSMPDGSIVLMGGDDGDYKNDVWCSVDNGATWTQMTANASWSGRHHHRSVAMPDGSIVLMGGEDGAGYKNDVWRSVDNGVTWTKIAVAAWPARTGHTSVLMPDGSIVLMGGFDGSGYKNDVWRSADKGVSWIQLPTPGWSVRGFHTSVATSDGSIVLMGGGDDGEFRTDVWRLSPVGSSEQNPSHSYNNAGLYPVALQVYNAYGHSSLQKTSYINVSPVFIGVAFNSTPTLGEVPLTVTFVDESTDNPTGWAWFFGDETYTDGWTEATGSAGWSERWEATSVSMLDGSIVLMGGFDGVAHKNDVWRSDNNGVTWTQMTASAGWSPRAGHTSISMPGGGIVLMGGNDGSNRNDVWWSIDNGATWTQMTANAGWSVRHGHTSVSMPDGSIVLMGGYDQWDNDYKNDVWRSDNNGVTWTLMTANAGWSGRFGHTSVVMPNGSIVLMGGSDGGFIQKNDVWMSVDNGATWTEVTGSAGWSGRAYHTNVVMPDRSIVLMGGYEGGLNYTNDVWRSVNNGATWTQLLTPGWSSRYSHTTVSMPDGSIVLMGGYNGNYTNDVWRLSPAGSSEQNPTHSYINAGLYPVALQVYNAYGYGSLQKTSYINVSPVSIGVAFNGTPTSSASPWNVTFTDESTGSNPTGWAWFFGDETYTEGWTEEIASGPWSSRDGHTSVSMPDGSILLIGGDDAEDYKNDVWRSTDKGVTWTEQTASGPWSIRDGHTSVVMPDGSILLMGGGDYYATMNDVWRSTDNGATWTLQNASAGWSGRFGHTGVSMPDGSIVLMGGSEVAYNYKNDVWKSTDNGVTWTELNASAGWSGRHGHTSVVMPDGSIVLMGGFDAGGFKNDVWRSFDNGVTWTKIAVAAWPARTDHTSVVMPDGSIVLMGGHDFNGNNLNDMWRSVDNGVSWTQLSTPGWSARERHTSVVMPDGSIVLMGGFDAGGYKNDVWRLFPAGSSEQNPSHSYIDVGLYPVALQVYNDYCYNSLQKPGYINISPVSIGVAFSGTPTSGTAPLDVAFTDESTDNPIGWAWFFGDETYTEGWTEETKSASWSARYYHTSDAMPDGSIVLMGGYDDEYKNDVWRSLDKGVTWTLQNANAGWSQRCQHTSVAMPDGSIVLMGGKDISRIYMNDVWRSVDKGVTWTLQNGSAGWSERCGHTSVVMPDGTIVLMGGNAGYQTNDVWRSVDKGVTWTQLPTPGWSARYYHTSDAMPDGSIILMGGYDIHGDHKNDVWRSTDNGATWTQMAANASWSGREDHTSVVMPDGSIVLMGGNDEFHIYKNEIWRSADNGVTWTNLPTPGWSARTDHTSVAMPDGSIVLMGGDDFNGNNKNDVWRLSPVGSSLQNPSHTYTDVGIYPVALQAYNADGYTSMQKTGYITVTSPDEPDNVLPAPELTVPSNPAANQSCRFAGTINGLPELLTLDFGDNTSPYTITAIGITQYNTTHTYTYNGSYTATLNVSIFGVGENSSTATVTVVNPIPEKKAEETAFAEIHGATTTTTEDNKQEITVNISEVVSSGGTVVTANDVITVTKSDNTVIQIVTESTQESGGNVSGNISHVKVIPPPVSGQISDAVGTAEVDIAITMSDYEETAAIETDISAGVADDARSAFCVACPAMQEVAYTVYFSKSGFTNDSAITEVTLNFSVKTAWVEARGGNDYIRILRWKDDGNSVEIIPTFVGISGENSVFQVTTDGLSVYAVASVPASSGGGSSSSGSGGGFQTGVGAVSDLKAGEETTLMIKNTAVTKVTILPAVNIPELMITVEWKSGPEDGVEPLDADIYQYDLVTLYKADAIDIAKITYTFEIPGDWLTEQNALPALWQYDSDEGVWNEYSVEITGKDTYTVISEATCPGVGWIALGCIAGEILDVGERTGDEVEDVLLPSDYSDVVSTDSKETVPVPEETASPFGVAGLLVGLGAAVILRRKS